MFRYLCAGVLSLALIGPAEAQSQAPTSPGQHGLFDFGSNTPGSEGFLTKQMLDTELGNYVTGAALTSALAPYLTQSQAASTYLPLTGGNTKGALNGVATFQGLVGASASGASTVLTTDGSGAVATGNCYQVPTQGVTRASITVVGVSSNGTDAVMQTYPGVVLFTANGVPALQGTSPTYYPVFGSPDPWSVAPTVDTSTKCVVITTKGSGSGSWKWRASIQYENLIP